MVNNVAGNIRLSVGGVLFKRWLSVWLRLQFQFFIEGLWQVIKISTSISMLQHKNFNIIPVHLFILVKIEEDSFTEIECQLRRKL